MCGPQDVLELTEAVVAVVPAVTRLMCGGCRGCAVVNAQCAADLSKKTDAKRRKQITFFFLNGGGFSTGQYARW